MKHKLILILLVGITIIYSCKKEAGEGGRATIKGKIYAEYWDKTFSIKGDSGYAADVDVYIIYGNNASYGNRVKTSYDGTYEFNYLQKGKYKIYAYSNDSTGRAADQANGNSNYLYNPNIAVVKEIEIKERKQSINVEEIHILK